MDRLKIEDQIRTLIGRRFGVELQKRKLVIGKRADESDRFHEFDGVSRDGQLVIEIKTNELRVSEAKPRGRYDSAIKQALILDLYMLSRLSAKKKLLVLTDRQLFDLCSRDMDGMLAPDTEIFHCTAE